MPAFTFRAKLLASHIALVASIVLLVLLELNRTLGADLVRQLDDRLEQQANGAAQWVGEGRRHPEKLAARLALVVHAQVTIFDREGDTVGDSSVADASLAPRENDAVEFLAARRGEVGRATRTTASGDVRFVAVPAGDGLVVRLGAPLSGIDETVAAMRRRLSFSFALAIAAALAFGWLASRLAARPLRAMTESATRIARGDYAIVPSDSRDDFGVLSRTLASLAKQLESDMARIDKLLAVRRDFVANVSHELRTPVTAIQGYSETLLRASLDEPTRKEFTEIVHRHAQRIAALVDGLLALSDLEARAPDQAVRERVDLRAIAEDVRATLRDRAAARHARIEIDVTDDAIPLGDPAQVEQVIENLVDNAIKYGKDDGGEVRVAARRERRDRDRVVVEVKDDGPGIEARHLPRLFERFYRVDAGRSRDRGGTGLGLAIVKHLVESMGGSVEVASEPGRGTTFRVELPPLR